MMDEENARRMFLDKSRSGEFAVADAATPMGALEVVSVSLERIAAAISDASIRD